MVRTYLHWIGSWNSHWCLEQAWCMGPLTNMGMIPQGESWEVHWRHHIDIAGNKTRDPTWIVLLTQEFPASLGLRDAAKEWVRWVVSTSLKSELVFSLENHGMMLCADHLRIAHQLCCRFPVSKVVLENALPCISLRSRSQWPVEIGQKSRNHIVPSDISILLTSNSQY